MKNEFVKLSGILCIITLTAALLLAGVNGLTEKKIAEASNRASQDAMKSIFTDADGFDKLTDTIYEGKKNGETVGYCVTVSANGFGGKIKMIVGLTPEDKIEGIEILEHSETPGLGAKSTSAEFENQFRGKKSALSVVKGKTDSEDEVSAITGATITSRAVANGVRAASDELKKALTGGDKQ